MKRTSILLVEDEPIISMMETKLLEKEGYHVITASRGDMAVQKVNSAPEKIDLILMDIDLGKGADGTQVAQEILKNHDIPILFLSSHTEKEIVERTEKITSYGYVVKNTGDIVLLASIKMALKLFDANKKVKDKNIEVASVNEELHATIEELESINDEIIKTEHELMESERVHTTLLKNLPGMVYRCKNDRNWTMEYLNEGCFDLTGYRPDDLLQNSKISFNDLILPEYREIIWNKWQELLSRDLHFEYEYPIRDAQGEIKWVWERGRGVSDPQGRLLYLEGYIEDISARKHAENDLITREEKFNKAFNSAPLLMSISDMKTGKYINVNQKFVDVSGFSREEALGKTTLELGWISDVDRKKLMDAMQSDGMVHKMSLTLTSKSGRDVHCLYFGEKIIVDGKEVLLSIAEDITERMESEKALRESDEINRLITENSPVALFLHQNGRFIFLNPAALKMLHASGPEELLGKPIIERVHPDFRGRVVERVKNSYAIGVNADLIEEKFLCLDGTVIDVQVHGVPIQYKGEKTMLIFAQEITEQKKLLDTLRESEERFRLSFVNANTGMCMIDLSGNLTRVNRKLCEMFGYTREEMEKLHVNSIAIPEDKSISTGFIKKALAGIEENNSYEKRFYHKDGHVVWTMISISLVHDARNNPSHFISQVEDITELRKSEEELLMAIKHLSAHFQNSPLAVVEFDPEFRITRWSGEAEKIFGWRSHEIVGKSIPDMRWVYEEDSKAVLEQNRGLLSGKIQKSLSVNRNYHKNGSVITCEWYNSAIYDSRGKLISILSLVLDITKRIQGEKELNKSLKDKDILFHELQHRVKNSLNIISSMLDLKTDQLPDNRSKNLFKEIISHIQSISLIYEHLNKSADLESIQLEDYISSFIDQFKRTFDIEGRELSIHLDLDSVRLDLKRTGSLGLILNELVTNSIKYAYPDGKGGEITIELKKTGEKLILSVLDNGAGFPDDFSLESSKSMGIKLVDLMARQMEGELSIENGNKTVVKVAIPL